MIVKKIFSLAASIIKLFILINFILNSNVFANNNKYYSNDKGILSIMYHRFNENKYPSTNINMEVFKKQFELIKEQKISFINPEDFNFILEHFKKAKISYNINKFFSKSDTNKIVSYMQNDKKNNSEKINLVLLRKIGSIDLKKKFSQQKIRFFIKEKLLN